MTPTSIVAWWGAILSTIVFLWDIYKHRTAGPRLRFTAQTGMENCTLTAFPPACFTSLANLGFSVLTALNREVYVR